MQQQRRADPYEANAFFDNGMVMRTPPAGTVVWDPGGASAVVTTGKIDGTPVADVPVPVTRELIAEGRHEYEIYCAVCHGQDGSGRSIMTPNMPGAPPPPLATDLMAAVPAGHLFEVISKGRNHMPDYGWALSPTERWAIIAYMQVLQRVHGTAGAAAAGSE
jgi:mono/diheme cytochrome c family protein